MSRLDYITIGIVVICLAALIFVIYKTTNILGNGSKEDTEQTQTAEIPEDDSYYPDGDNYTYDDEGEILDDAYEEEDLDEGYDSEDYVDTEEEDFFDKGTEEVTTTATNPSTSINNGFGDYLVLAGSYKIKSNAENVVAKLQRLGYDGAEVSIFNKGAYATVLVSRFDDEASARSLAAKLKDDGIDAYVHLKR